jgi:sec-independent protein translocase protein TatB
MFGIGLPEMIVILAVALIVVGPDKLPDLARSLAKGVFELKKTLNQVKASLAEEENLLGSVKSDLHKTANDLKNGTQESDHFEFRDPVAGNREAEIQDGDIIDVESEQLPSGGPEEGHASPPVDNPEQVVAAGTGNGDEKVPVGPGQPPRE